MLPAPRHYIVSSVKRQSTEILYPESHPHTRTRSCIQIFNLTIRKNTMNANPVRRIDLELVFAVGIKTRLLREFVCMTAFFIGKGALVYFRLQRVRVLKCCARRDERIFSTS